MASIRSTDTKPERLLRQALWQFGARGWRCNWRGPGGRIDIAFTRWKVAVLVDGSFWHGHPSKWQPGRWQGYWDEKIKRNIARDARQNEVLAAEGWAILRFWDFEIQHDTAPLVSQVRRALDDARAAAAARNRTSVLGAARFRPPSPRARKHPVPR
jgi:DNA mismatch endonuclease, patch repair protein